MTITLRRILHLRRNHLRLHELAPTAVHLASLVSRVRKTEWRSVSVNGSKLLVGTQKDVELCPFFVFLGLLYLSFFIITSGWCAWPMLMCRSLLKLPHTVMPIEAGSEIENALRQLYYIGETGRRIQRVASDSLTLYTSTIGKKGSAVAVCR